MFAYTADEAYSAMGHLDSNQRHIYSLGIWILDMPYMVIYCMLFSGFLVKIWKNRRTALLPLAILLMDLFENLSILAVLGSYPAQNQLLANAASFFTTAKWILVGILLCALIAGVFSVVRLRRYAALDST